MKNVYLFFIVLLVSYQARSQSRPLPPGGDASARVIKFYPNPATSIINFDFQKDYDRSYSFQIFSFLGRKVFEISNVTPKTVVNLGDFYRGIYIFQLRDRNGRVVDSNKE
jgi:hypothetical protein